MYSVYETFNEKCSKNVTIEHNDVLIIMGSEVKFNIYLRLLTKEDIIFMSKIVRQWLINYATIQFLLLGIV